jgi:hypothetical protein
VAGDHQHRHLVAAVAEHPQHLEAVDLRHLDVEDDGLRSEARHLRHRLGAARRLLDLVPLVLEDHPQAVANRRLVVDDEDQRSGGAFAGRHVGCGS